MSYLSANEIRAANEYGESLRRLVHEKKFPSTERARAALGCLIIAQEHHHGILVLLSHSLFASAFALVRPAFESYIRGQWLSLCAKEAQVQGFLRGKEPPKFASMIDALEALEDFDNKMFSVVKNKNWKGLCGYTHTGGIHVQRWQTSDGVEPNYSKEEVIEVLKFADVIAGLSVLAVLREAADEAEMTTAAELVKTRLGLNKRPN